MIIHAVLRILYASIYLPHPPPAVQAHLKRCIQASEVQTRRLARARAPVVWFSMLEPAMVSQLSSLESLPDLLFYEGNLETLHIPLEGYCRIGQNTTSWIRYEMEIGLHSLNIASEHGIVSASWIHENDISTDYDDASWIGMARMCWAYVIMRMTSNGQYNPSTIKMITPWG